MLFTYKSIIIATIKKNFLAAWLELTPSLINKQLVIPPATIPGHIKQEHQDLRSTKIQRAHHIIIKKHITQFILRFTIETKHVWI